MTNAQHEALMVVLREIRDALQRMAWPWYQAPVAPTQPMPIPWPLPVTSDPPPDTSTPTCGSTGEEPKP